MKMNFEEFIRKDPEPQTPPAPIEEEEVDSAEPGTDDIDVQKAVVEALAADKAEIEEEVNSLRSTIAALESEKSSLACEVKRLSEELAAAKEEQKKIDEFLSRDIAPDNSERVPLLDRKFELSDRFEGESRDHIIEILREARDVAEKEGRLRRAQILEAVLVENEPAGILSQKRAELEKLFADNHYILNGEVINRLDNFSIQYKIGENYLLPEEIIKRLY